MSHPVTTTYGTYPEPLAAEAEGRKVIIKTRYYEIEHDLSQGGAISSIIYAHGRGRNLLLGPMSASISLDDGKYYSNIHESHPEVAIDSNPDEIRLELSGFLRDSDGNPGPVRYTYTYRYRWGYVKVQKRFHFPEQQNSVKYLCVHRYLLRPELDSYGTRPAAELQAIPDYFGIDLTKWGQVSPGDHFNCPWRSRFIPRYLACAEQGIEGLEWFVGSNLAEWSYDLTGTIGNGYACISSSENPLGVSVEITPIALPRGGAKLSGTYSFTFYHGFPILTGRAHRPFLHATFNRKHWPSEEKIATWARRGIRTAHFHHDGDSFRDGLFWRDGTYPPFGPEDMAEYDRVIKTCHQYGIRVATYFSNKELHPSTQAYKEHAEEWARMPHEGGIIGHNYYAGDEFGAQMCLSSGWLDYFKNYVDTVLAHHALDGVYYDWNAPLYCHNPRHVRGMKPSKDNSPISGTASGAPIFSPVGHWDVDELLDLMEWTRRRVGEDGLVIVHNTMTPFVAFENFADYVVAMEWGYGKLSTGVPDLNELPLEWNFMGARSRGVIGYGCLVPGAPEWIGRQLVIRALLTGVAPWTAEGIASTLELFQPISGLDMSCYAFTDWRNNIVCLDNNHLASAVYRNAKEAVIIVGNLTRSPQTAKCRIDPKTLGWPDPGDIDVAVDPTHSAIRTSAAALVEEGIPVEVGGDSISVVRLVRA